MTKWKVIAITLAVICAVVALSYAYDVIDMTTAEEMTEEFTNKLPRLACSAPSSRMCGHFNKTGKIRDPELGRYWLKHYVNTAYVEAKYRNAQGSWNYETNITKGNAKEMHRIGDIASSLMAVVKAQTEMLDPVNLDEISKRIISFMMDGGFYSTIEHAREASAVQDNMTTIFATGKVCRERKLPNKKRSEICMHMEPGLQHFMSISRDYDELLWAWKGWHDAVGPKIGKLYPTYVSLSNEAARNGGYEDYGGELRSTYEDPNFIEEIDALWNTVKPMYLQIHAFTRRRLVEKYGADKVNSTGPIPAHLLGNMWAQKWGQIYDLLTPYPGHGVVDVTEEMQKQKWTVNKMFHAANDFFKSLGWRSMPEAFWEKSLLERPHDRQVECHGSAFDFYKNREVRIKMCTEITMEDLYTAHHEMGHCQYFLHYRHQHAELRGGANPGFHEAVGDTIALSVVTPDYLHHLGLLPTDEVDEELQINYLMRVALDKISFLPFGLLIDKWRWKVFSGEIQPDHYNTAWWQMRRYYQGLESPIERKQTDFDPGAKYHIASGTPYIRYFVSFIIQFQFHQKLCEISNSTKPLHLCNNYNSKEAGKKFGSMLKMGMSKPWQDAMEELTGQRRMDASAIIEYFQPLIKWLTEENEKNNEKIGWDYQRYHLLERELTKMELIVKMVVLYMMTMSLISITVGLSTTDQSENNQEHGSNYNETQFEIFLEEFNQRAMDVYSYSIEKSWIYNTNITEYNRHQMIEASVTTGSFSNHMRERALVFNDTNFTDTNQRHYRRLVYVGNAALKNVSEMEEGANLVARMKGRYSTGKVCKEDGTCYNLNPGLSKIMASSRNYSELLWAWDSWRAAVGPANRQDFVRYVVLKNKVAVANGESNAATYWQSAYGNETFPVMVEELYQQIRPLYEQLHAYVRRKLYGVYGPKYINLRGPIPAHIVGNMWAQTWGGLYDICKPFPNKARVDVTKSMVEKNYTTSKMFEMANEFFTSLGLISVPTSFWNDSMFVRPTHGRSVNCHPSAWDFYNQVDFRIKMCTSITVEDLNTIHHELGHIQYYLQYKDQHVHFRGGANPAFHEAVGDVMSLSAATPGHLYTIGLLDEIEYDEEADLNHLMKVALTKIAFLPFGYLMDQWRWSVFDGTTPPSKYNQEWWKLRLKYQGIIPPNERSEDDFDPAAKYHISAGVPYIRYFVSFFLQFQFHDALCKAAGHDGPLHRCDIYRSREAGLLLSNMLSKGSSHSWNEALEAMTGSKEMNATALVSYFQPLMEYLRKENERNNETLGWPEMYTPFDPSCGVRIGTMSPSTFILVLSSSILWTRLHYL
ncbi:angiotensin-converting enzyme-like [Lytechinus variegatus]|uniref:angiotensin-converting enzyme-like n=1 Tax=Lytechinus variegatus TaxID=7654 RepID=UPI001BB11A70|nr:angiotensin-converting enzyme-like [Lytechinus variegatus]